VTEGSSGERGADISRRRVRPFLRKPAGPGETPAEPGQRLRPYILTAGRVPDDIPHIGLETQVSAHRHQSTQDLAPQVRAVVEVCAEPISVAEISARLHLHLGVARLLVADLYTSGHVEVHATEDVDAQDPDTILRVIRGLRKIG